MNFYEIDATFATALQRYPDDMEAAIAEMSHQIVYSTAEKRPASDAVWGFAIAVQTIGCWLSGGVLIGIYSNCPNIVPHIPRALNRFDMPHSARAFEAVTNTMPSTLVFGDEADAQFCEAWNAYDFEDPVLTKQINEAENALQTDWGNTEEPEWARFESYLKAHPDQLLWRQKEGPS